jgi:hypothetical protein
VLVALPLLRAAPVRAFATSLVAAACIASLFFYRDVETAFGRRFIAGYHTHYRVDSAIGAFDEPPTLDVSTHATHWWGVAAVWVVRVGFVALLFGLPLLTWRALSSLRQSR